MRCIKFGLVGLARVLVLASVGFDERFIVRHIVSTGLGVGSEDIIYAFIPTGDDERGLRVIEAVKELISRYGLHLTVDSLSLDVGDFWGSAGKVRRTVEDVSKKRSPQAMHILLGGGMRVLGFIIFTGALAARYKPQESTTYIYREDLRGHITFPLEIFKIERPPQHIIDTLMALMDSGKSSSISSLARSLRIAKSTLHRRVAYMEKTGLVTIERRGRSSRIKLLDPAKLWI